jgi:hypothetical protein
LSGSLLLRAAERALSALLFQDPPRTTRATSQGTPQNCTLRAKYERLHSKGQKETRAASRRSVNSKPAVQRSAAQWPAIRWGTHTTPASRH